MESIIEMTLLYGENMVVITNVSIQGRNIKKNYHARTYHFIIKE